MKTFTYKDSGVDIKKAENLLDDMKSKIQNTFNPHVLNSIGAFAALTEVPKDYTNPVLVSSTDGVGTKLKIAFMSGKHDTVGIDLVGMSVNDILTLGAKPFFFLDYFASGEIEDSVYKAVISGICDGCEAAGCALIGGETAEMPSFYQRGEYDLAGFAVGIVEKDGIIDGASIKEGDAIIGLASNGLHSNGYSLVRKVLFDTHNLNVTDMLGDTGVTLSEELLRPTRIYVKPVLEVARRYNVKGMVHITGGGLPGNIKRVIPDGLSAAIDLAVSSVPFIFRYIMDLGNINFKEMCSTFNMGTGYVLVVDKNDERQILDLFLTLGESPSLLGYIEPSQSGDKVRIIE
jgi:phosphoribosylformylglycinamidine cyclo-ligase